MLDSTECHVSGDFWLIYQCVANTVMFVRSGTHSDLFEERCMGDVRKALKIQ